MLVYSAAKVLSGCAVASGVAVAAGEVGSGITVVIGLSDPLPAGTVAAGTVGDGSGVSFD